MKTSLRGNNSCRKEVCNMKHKIIPVILLIVAAGLALAACMND